MRGLATCVAGAAHSASQAVRRQRTLYTKYAGSWLMNPEIDLNQLVDEFLRFEKYVEESKLYERVVAAPSLSDDQLFLERDWQRFVAYKYNQVGMRDGLQDAMRDGYVLLLQKLTELAQQAGAEHSGLDNE